MACSATLLGLPKDCDKSMGGIAAIWLAPYEEGAVTTSTADTGVVYFNTAYTTSDFHKYYFKKGTCSMTSTLNVDATNGSNYVSTELVMQFNKMEVKKRTEISALSNYDVMAVVKDANGKYWFLGKDLPMTASAANGQTGQARTDGNFYTITLTDESNDWPYELSASAVQEIEAIDFPTA